MRLERLEDDLLHLFVAEQKPGVGFGEVTQTRVGRPEVHDRRRLPYVLAGSAGKQLQTGRYLKYDANPHNQLLASFSNLFGIEAEGFGEPDYPGTLPNLV